ncbi:Zinc finger protein klf1 [Colletotrichum sp. SAR11_240]|nr:Zinc finger protein klf1 [Colletotrichum sp. SAR11_240]
MHNRRRLSIPGLIRLQSSEGDEPVTAPMLRIAFHEDGSESPEGPSEPDSGENSHAPPVEADLAAAVSLSGMSVDHWSQPPPPPPPQPADLYPMAVPRNGGLVDASYQQTLITDQFYENGNQDVVGFDAHFREFANFLDGVGLPAEWSPYFHGPDRDNDIVDPGMRDSRVKDSREGTATPGPRSRTRPGTPFSSWLPSAPTGNRISENLPDAIPRSVDNESQPYRISDEQRSRLNASIESFRDILDPNFKFPSRHALTRYLTSYFEGFHSHMPFLHTPTWRIFEHSLELILGLAAVGAQYCFEHRMSERLFYAGKAILMERLAHESDKFGPKTGSSLNMPQRRESRPILARDWGPWEPIETVRALIALMGYATWEPKVSLMQEAFGLQGLLAQVLRERIYIVRDLSLPVMDHSASLPSEEVDKLERGLRSWTAGWQQAPESSLDPNNENGPIPFTSSSLLGLAYVRIYLHLGPYRLLETRDPIRIAKAIYRSPAVERSGGVITALLYTAHMLSIPVRLGVDRVARSQAFFWSVRHSLSGLECAVLLSKWLFSLTEASVTTPLSDSEDRILHWVRCIVEEAYDVVDFDDDEPEVGVDRDPASLSLAVLRIWAHFFKSNTQWPFINMIGESLEKYRELLMRSRPQQAT